MKHNLMNLKTAVPILGTLLGLMLSTPPTLAQNKTIQLPISDFLKAQGTFGTSFLPPIPDFLGLGGYNQPGNNNPDKGYYCASVDYAGLVDKTYKQLGLNTTFSGKVTIRPVSATQEQVQVILHTQNTLTWAVDDCSNFATAPPVFGYRASDLLQNTSLRPALANSSLSLVFLQPKGSPLPDILQLTAENPEPYTLISLGFVASATGNLPNGSLGRLQITQKGLFQIPSQSPKYDAFPVETVNIIPIGKKP